VSSHHIVRENQEPALFIQDPDALSFEKIQELLEWSPTVIVPYRQVAHVVQWGIKVDVVLCQPQETAPARALLETQFPVKLVSVNNPSEEFSTVVFWLKRAGYQGVYLITHDPTVFDFSSWPPDFDVEVFQGGSRWLHVPKGVFQKWYPAGTAIQIRNDVNKSDVVVAQDELFFVRRTGSFWIGETFTV
jgi:hypothetical protein